MSVAGAPERVGYVPSAFAEPLSALGDAPAPASYAPSSSSSGAHGGWTDVSSSGVAWPLATAALSSYDAGEGAVAAAAAVRGSSSSSSSMMASSFLGATRGTLASSSLQSASFVNPSASLINISSNTVDEFAALFASHETWFKAATLKRADVYASLQNEAVDILRMLQESEARSQAVLGRIGELDVIIAEEKARLMHA